MNLIITKYKTFGVLECDCSLRHIVLISDKNEYTSIQCRVGFDLGCGRILIIKTLSNGWVLFGEQLKIN